MRIQKPDHKLQQRKSLKVLVRRVLVTLCTLSLLLGSVNFGEPVRAQDANQGLEFNLGGISHLYSPFNPAEHTNLDLRPLVENGEVVIDENGNPVPICANTGCGPKTSAVKDLDGDGLGEYVWGFSGAGHGEGGHLGSDYYSQDWNLGVFDSTHHSNLDDSGNVDRTREPDYDQPLYASAPGEIVVSESDGYGDTVVIKITDSAYQATVTNDDGSTGNETRYFALRYAHLNRRDVVVGDIVAVGDPIGSVGNTGPFTNAVHLHLVLYKNYVDNSSKIYYSCSGDQCSTDQNSYAAEFRLDAGQAQVGNNPDPEPSPDPQPEPIGDPVVNSISISNT